MQFLNLWKLFLITVLNESKYKRQHYVQKRMQIILFLQFLLILCVFSRCYQIYYYLNYYYRDFDSLFSMCLPVCEWRIKSVLTHLMEVLHKRQIALFSVGWRANHSLKLFSSNHELLNCLIFLIAPFESILELILKKIKQKIIYKIKFRRYEIKTIYYFLTY